MILVVKGENRACRFHFIWMLADLSLKPHNAHIRKKVMISSLKAMLTRKV